MKKAKTTATALAMLAVLQTGAAQAQQACVTEREVAHMAIYAVPSLVQGVRSKCASRLTAEGFLARKGDSFSARYAAMQPETWPAARSGLMKFASSKAENAQMANMLGDLPDEAVRPFVDAIVSQEISKSVKVKDCRKIERGFQLAAPLSPRDAGAIIGFIMAMVSPKNPQVCQD